MLCTRPKRPNLLLLIVVLAAGHCFAADDRAAGKAERIDKVVARYAKYGYLNGAVLVAEHGKIIYEKGIGEATWNRMCRTPRTQSSASLR